MRKDLSKVIHEHERSGHKRKYKAVRRSKGQKLDEEGPSHESMKRNYTLSGRYGARVRRESAPNFKAVDGLIRKWINRPWDKFNSVLRNTYDSRTKANQEIFQWVDDQVERRDIYVDEHGTVRVRNRWQDGEKVDIPVTEDTRIQFYVNPKTGIICENSGYRTTRQQEKARAEQEAQEKAKVFVEVDANTVLHRIDGVWFRFTMEDLVPESIEYGKPYGVDEFFHNGEMVRWRDLDDEARITHGERRINSNSRHDRYYQMSVVLGWNPIFPVRGKGNHTYVHLSRYHATKSTAPRQLLKKLGLVN